MTNLETLKEIDSAPMWMTNEGYSTLSKGYLLNGETPRDMYSRLARTAANKLNKPELESKFFDLFWKNWLCPATPVAANLGTERGLPISCFGTYVSDSVDGIFKSFHEIAMLTKNGGGIGTYYGGVRGRGKAIAGNGVSEGIIPWLKILDSIMIGVSQGSTRRGAAAVYLDATHPDIDEFLEIRKPTGDVNRRCLNLHAAVSLTDEFMFETISGNPRNRNIWEKLLEQRFTTGEPYLFFKDTVNRNAPQMYKHNNLEIKTSQLCNEIHLYNDENHTFVCCLSSMNLLRWEEWKDTDAVQLSIWFLDAVMQEFIDKAKLIPGMEKAVRFSEKSRALGLGVLGWHSLLQAKNLAFDSFDSMMLNSRIFSHIKKESEIASEALSIIYGEPEWCKGFKRRNTHLIAVAPTVSNSIISGGVSAGIEPIAANIFSLKTAKGTFIRKNPQLQALLSELGKDIPETWAQINQESGSVKNLKFLSNEQKEVYATARELNQHSLIKQAAQRQKFIDQGQSLNLFFDHGADVRYINEVHLEAWKNELKGLYYCRTESVLRSDGVYRSKDECKSCEG